jgi:hypothetical protein
VIQINIGDHSGNENGVPFAQIPKGLVPQVRWALTKAVWIAQRVKTANVYYASLPRGRTLASLFLRHATLRSVRCSSVGSESAVKGERA